MGSCFLGFLETQSKLLTSASDLMAPLGAYREVGKGLSDSSSDPALKEATVGWLAAAQVREVVYIIMQWKLFIVDTLDTTESVLITEVSFFTS